MTKPNLENTTKKKSNWFLKTIFLIVILLITYFFIGPGRGFNKPRTDQLLEKSIDSNKKYSAEFIKSVVTNEDTNSRIIYLSDSIRSGIECGFDEQAGKEIKRIYNGRRINIAITGVDSRMGTTTKHADANHVLSILIDSGKIEIISIPRDTPADAGYEDSTGQNKLTIVRAGKGREAYLKELARIAELDKIHYYVEFGFSQAIGILEFLGYDNAGSTLQILRSRQGLGGDDFQRQYNQGQFIKQTIISNFRRLEGLIGDVLIRGGLAIVETNLNHAIIKSLIDQLSKKKFADKGDDITIRVRPAIPVKFKVYDFTSEEVITQLSQKILNYNESRSNIDSTFRLSPKSVDISNKLNNLIYSAAKDSARNSASVIKKLGVYFDQRAWLQVPNRTQRDTIRTQIGKLLISAYSKKKNIQKVQEVQSIIDAEKNLFINSKSQINK